MTIKAFEAYRYNARVPVTLPRLIIGTLLVLAAWGLFTVVTLFVALQGQTQALETVLASRSGLIATLLSLGGIWIGVWLAMRLVDREPLGKALGADGKLDIRDFWKGFAAVVLTSVLSEFLIYAIRPEMARSALPLSEWLLWLAPVFVLCLIQTSGEEVLFRGYLLRGLANRFRSPWIWAVLPAVLFVAIHYQPQMTMGDIGLVLLTIGSLTILLVWLVYATGNLGAAMGVHMGNNLFAFLLIGHQDGLTSFALFKGAPVGDGSMTPGQTAALVGSGWLCVAITWWLLASARSPLNTRKW